MAKKQRDKGKRVELKIVNLHKTELDIDAARISPLEAGRRFKGDIILYPKKRKAGVVCQVKARKTVAGFKGVTDALEGHDRLFLVFDHQPPIVVMTWDDYVRHNKE
tara:strand:- start:869 stop:1186 length:318 start_codon:yes stop_codon:yes gene_type:complete